MFGRDCAHAFLSFPATELDKEIKMNEIASKSTASEERAFFIYFKVSSTPFVSCASNVLSQQKAYSAPSRSPLARSRLVRHIHSFRH